MKMLKEIKCVFGGRMIECMKCSGSQRVREREENEKKTKIENRRNEQHKRPENPIKSQ